MNPEEWNRVKELFACALDREAEQRGVFLREACGGNERLRQEVESLLSAHQSTSAPVPPLEDAQRDTLVGRRLGSYQIIREIGQGGMATVYLAARADAEFRKRVAVKLLSQALAGEDMLHRFRNERQTLAALDHPNIVKLLDGGTTEEGLPYLVMDYVEGIPIDEYCDGHRLSTTERLKLFCSMCSAAHYAHQNLVIHRDLKPANILVTSQGVPKLLDFGIAKLLNPEFASHTLLVTQANMRAMTPEYASPEQVRGDPITTATDIYSLGVVLYELMTGHPPYRLKRHTPAEMERVICDSEPERPSTAVTRPEEIVTSDGTTQTVLTPEEVSRVREGPPQKLRRRLSGDLDNIILMALRKEPQRRYKSVEQFSEDIRHHLEGLPVIARPATLLYRSSKFVRRHKAGVAAAALLCLTLIAGIVATGWEAHQARLEKARAEQRFNDVRQLANSFLFDFDEKIKNLRGATPARQLVVGKALQYLNRLSAEARGDAPLQRELAQAYIKVGDIQGMQYRANLGDAAGALQSYTKAQEIARQLSAAQPGGLEDRKLLARSLYRVGMIQTQMGQTTEAVDKLRKAIEMYEPMVAADRKDLQARLDLADWYNTLGDSLGHGSAISMADSGAALEQYRNSLQNGEAVLALDEKNQYARRIVAVAHSKIADSLLALGDRKTALDSYRVSLAEFKALAEEDPTSGVAQRQLSIAYGRLADALWEGGDRKQSAELYRKSLGITQQLVTADPSDMVAKFGLAADLRNMGDVLVELKDLPAAIEHYRKAVAIVDELSTSDPGNLLRRSQLGEGLIEMGALLAKNKQIEEAHRTTMRGLVIRRQLAERTGATPHEISNYIQCLLTCKPVDLRDPATAKRVAQDAVQASNAANPEFLDDLAMAYFATGDAAHAVEAEKKALDLLQPAQPQGPVLPVRKQFGQNLAKYEKALRNSSGMKR